METIQTTSLSSQNISSPLLIDTYTVDKARELIIQIYLSGIAGDGTYGACLTKQIGGTGTAYQMPTSNIAVASTVTTVSISTIKLAVDTDDVIKVYVEGLSGDTNVTTVIIDTYDIQYQIIDDVTTLISGSGIIDGKIDIIDTNVDLISGSSTVLISGSGIIEDKIDIISGSIPSLALEATLTAIKGAGWTDETLIDIREAITSGAITTEDIWTYFYRVLTPSNTESTSEPNISNTPIDIYTYSSTSISTTCIDADEVWFTVKKNINDLDSESLIQVSKTGSLLYINGQSASTAGLSADYATLTMSGGKANVFISGSAAPSLLGTKEKDYTGEVKRRMNSGTMPIVTQFPITLKGGLTQTL